MTALAREESVGQAKLAAGAVGLVGQLFQSIANMAPAAGVIFSAQYMASKGGATLPLAWLLATVACLLTALAMRQVVRKIRSAGSFFVIHSVALGHFVGFTTSWVWLLNEPLVAGGLSMFFGQILQDFLATQVGVMLPWWITALALIAIFTYLSYVGIRQSAGATVLLGSIEIAIMLVLGLILIIKAGANQPLIAFSPAASPQGWGGVGFAMVFGILSYLGFESGIPLSEESKNPRRSLSITILASTIGMGAYFCFLGYATVAGWGYSDPQKFAADFSGATNPYFTLAQNAFGVIGPWVILFAVANTAFGGAITAYNAITRVYYSLGRSGVFPRWFGHVNPSTQTPDHAILFEGALAAVCALGLGFAFGTSSAWGLLGIVWTIAVTIVYMMSCLSCIALYWGKYREEFNVVSHLLVPLLGIVVFIPALISGLAPQILFGYTNDYPFSLALPIVVVWALVGLALYGFLRVSGRERLDAMANEMAHVELAGEEYDPRARATLS